MSGHVRKNVFVEHSRFEKHAKQPVPARSYINIRSKTYSVHRSKRKAKSKMIQFTDWDQLRLRQYLQKLRLRRLCKPLENQTKKLSTLSRLP